MSLPVPWASQRALALQIGKPSREHMNHLSTGWAGCGDLLMFLAHRLLFLPAIVRSGFCSNLCSMFSPTSHHNNSKELTFVIRSGGVALLKSWTTAIDLVLVAVLTTRDNRSAALTVAPYSGPERSITKVRESYGLLALWVFFVEKRPMRGRNVSCDFGGGGHVLWSAPSKTTFGDLVSQVGGGVQDRFGEGFAWHVLSSPEFSTPLCRPLILAPYSSITSAEGKVMWLEAPCLTIRAKTLRGRSCWISITCILIGSIPASQATQLSFGRSV